MAFAESADGLTPGVRRCCLVCGQILQLWVTRLACTVAWPKCQGATNLRLFVFPRKAGLRPGSARWFVRLDLQCNVLTGNSLSLSKCESRASSAISRDRREALLANANKTRLGRGRTGSGVKALPSPRRRLEDLPAARDDSKRIS